MAHGESAPSLYRQCVMLLPYRTQPGRAPCFPPPDHPLLFRARGGFWRAGRETGLDSLLLNQSDGSRASPLAFTVVLCAAGRGLQGGDQPSGSPR